MDTGSYKTNYKESGFENPGGTALGGFSMDPLLTGQAVAETIEKYDTTVKNKKRNFFRDQLKHDTMQLVTFFITKSE